MTSKEALKAFEPILELLDNILKSDKKKELINGLNENISIIRKDLEVLEILKKLFPIQIIGQHYVYSKCFYASNVDDNTINKLKEWLEK